MIKKISHHKDKIILLKLASLQVLINFFTNYLIVKKIGFSSELDVYYVAMAVFGFLSTSIGWSISSVLTPILIENREKRIEGYMFVSILFIVIPIFLFTLVSMPIWIKFIFHNFLQKVSYQKIVFIQSMFLITFAITSINILFYAIFQEKNEYIKINFLNMIGAIIGFIFIYFTIDKFGIYSASLYQLVIQIFLFFIMGIFTFKIIKINLKFRKEYFLLLWHRMKYIFFGSFYYRTDELIERFIASYLTSGFLSLVAFVQRIYGAIITVLNTSIAGPTITKFSNLIKEKKFNEVKKTLYNYLFMLLIIDIIIFSFVFFFGKDLFLYFFSDRIDKNLIDILFYVIVFLFAMVFGKTLGQILHNLLLSLKLEKEITIFDSITFTINILIKIVLSIYFGMIGLISAIVIAEIIKNSAKYYLVIKNLRKIKCN